MCIALTEYRRRPDLMVTIRPIIIATMIYGSRPIEKRRRKQRRAVAAEQVPAITTVIATIATTGRMTIGNLTVRMAVLL